MKTLDIYSSAVELPEIEEDLQTVLKDKNDLIIHNDDFNTFDFVIDSLIEVCGHDVLQAEQCTYIIHYNGKCGVKMGTKEELKPMHTELLNRGLTAEIA